MTWARSMPGWSFNKHIACSADVVLQAIMLANLHPGTTDRRSSVACMTGMEVEAVALNSAQWLAAPAMATAWDQDRSDESYCMADFTHPSSDYTPDYGLLIGAPLAPFLLGVLVLVYFHCRWKAQAKAAKQESQPQAATRPTPLARLRSFGWRAAHGTRGQGAFPREAPRWTYAGPPSGAGASFEAQLDAEAPISCSHKDEAAQRAKDPKRHAWW